MSNETEELNMPGFGFVWDFGDKQMRLTKDGVELSLTFEQAGSLVEQIWRLLDDAGAGPAAGPWIRVDSGERPRDGTCIIVADMDDGVASDTAFGGYLGEEGNDHILSWHINDDWIRSLSFYTHWARIYPPGKP